MQEGQPLLHRQENGHREVTSWCLATGSLEPGFCTSHPTTSLLSQGHLGGGPFGFRVILGNVGALGDIRGSSWVFSSSGMITSQTLLRVLCNQNHPLLPMKNHYLNTALRGILDPSGDHDPLELCSEVTLTKAMTAKSQDPSVKSAMEVLQRGTTVGSWQGLRLPV